jgi:hypothetical protein
MTRPRAGTDDSLSGWSGVSIGVEDADMRVVLARDFASRRSGLAVGVEDADECVALVGDFASGRSDLAVGVEDAGPSEATANLNPDPGARRAAYARCQKPGAGIPAP